MSSRRALTGGTGDVNPQALSWSITESGTDTTTVFTLNIPIQRLPQGRGAQVLEILRVSYNGATFGGGTAALAAYQYVSL